MDGDRREVTQTDDSHHRSTFVPSDEIITKASPIYGTNNSLPVVARLSSSRWASGASASGIS